MRTAALGSAARLREAAPGAAHPPLTLPTTTTRVPRRHRQGATGPHRTKAGWSNRRTAYTHERRLRLPHPGPLFTPLPVSASLAPPAAAQPDLLPGCSGTALRRRRSNGRRMRARICLTSAHGPQPPTPLGYAPTSRGWKRAQRLALLAPRPLAPPSGTVAGRSEGAECGHGGREVYFAAWC